VAAAITIQLGYAAVSGERDLYSIFRDDAFYYFVIAKNIVTTGFSSFDGVLPTNGYHPLWLVLLLPLTWLFGAEHRTLLFAVLVLGAVAACASLRLLQLLLPRLVLTRLDPTNPQAATAGRDPAAAEALLTFAAACAMAVVLQMTFLGMESLVAVPALLLATKLLLDLLSDASPSKGRAAGLGLAISVLCLARLDAILFGLLAALAVAWSGRKRPAVLVRAFAFMAIGASPLFLYFAFNWVHYGHALTTSAMAKNLAPGFRINRVALGFLFSAPVAPFTLVGAAAGVALFRERLWPGSSARRAASVVVLFAFGYFAVLVFTTSWQLWRWYLYPLVPCVALGASVLARWALHRFPRHARRLPLVAGLAALSLPMAVLSTSLLSRGNIAAGIFDSARSIERFERAHPGRYAMGDAAGMAGFLMQRPPLQLEGLVADYSLLEHLRRRDDLGSVLRQYRVDYLIDRGPSELAEGCRRVSIPNAKQAGVWAPKMVGRFCDPPIELAANLRVFPVGAAAAPPPSP
jgi:hypothetical protein